MDHTLLTIPQTCGRLKLGRSKIYQLLANRELVAIRIGRSVRFDTAVIDAYVAKLQAEAEAEA
jgi:excisionase family DNA binding protein